MTTMLEETIVAIASPPGGAARGILRLSGPNVVACVERVFHAEEVKDATRLSAIRRPRALDGWLEARSGEVLLPCDLYLWPTTRSFTGQPMAEFHTLGSGPLLEVALEALTVAGARLAEPGEFTLRAFLSGRLDLTQAEAVLAVIDAADPRQFDVALTQLAGGLGGPLVELRDSLLDLAARLEAGFDFADEDLALITETELSEQLALAIAKIDDLAVRMAARRETTERIRLVLLGWPNTGKSSLFNALTNRIGALVSEQPGTTRDYLTAQVDFGRIRCLLVDTAGVETDLLDEEEPLRTATRQATDEQTIQAEVILLCLDSTRSRNDWEEAQVSDSAENRLLVGTKIDIGRRNRLPSYAISTSSRTGEGIEALTDRLGETIEKATVVGGEFVAGTAVRCRESLRLAVESLRRVEEILHAGGENEELIAFEIRFSLNELGKTVGSVYTEDILDRVFSRFCIGK